MYSFNVVTLPFLDSNIAEELCYSVFFSQVLRFLRICSTVEDFVERTKELSTKLMQRNYRKKKLATKLNRVLFRYNSEWSKFVSRYLPHEITILILFS